MPAIQRHLLITHLDAIKRRTSVGPGAVEPSAALEAGGPRDLGVHGGSGGPERKHAPWRERGVSEATR
jgi:hypothetical protein